MPGKPFEPGNKLGKGRRPGSRNKKSKLEEALEEHGEVIIRKCKVMALNGDVTAMRLLMERLVPIAKAPVPRFRLPKMRTASDLKDVLPSILKQTAEGKINPFEAEALSRIVETQQRTVESDLAERVRVLEELSSNPLVRVESEDDDSNPLIPVESKDDDSNLLVRVESEDDDLNPLIPVESEDDDS